MFIQKSGRNRLKVTNNMSSDSYSRLRTRNHPWVAAANTRLAMSALVTVSSSAHHESIPNSINWVLKMNMNGSSAVRSSYLNACTPTAIGSQRATPAAA